VREGCHFYWSYPTLLKDTLDSEESPYTRHAPYKNHHGKFTYPSVPVPRSPRIQVEMVCSLPSATPVGLKESLFAPVTLNYIQQKSYQLTSPSLLQNGLYILVGTQLGSDSILAVISSKSSMTVSSWMYTDPRNRLRFQTLTWPSSLTPWTKGSGMYRCQPRTHVITQ
jgi:hypothetical protein